MNTNKIKMAAMPGWLGLILLFISSSALLAAEETFPSFQVGTVTYQNVTVTTKAKKYIFILHSTGMANIKVAELSPELQKELGYASPAQGAGKSGGSRLTDWTKQKVALLETPKVKAAEKSMQETWQAHGVDLASFKSADRNFLLAVAGGALLFYVFNCYCHKLICEKAGKKPGVLIWLPVLQIIPMFEAAGMSLLWVLLPPLAPIVWCFKIAKARGKSAGVGFALLLPVIGFLTFLYLAFSDGPEPKEERVVEVMCLETA